MDHPHLTDGSGSITTFSIHNYRIINNGMWNWNMFVSVCVCVLILWLFIRVPRKTSKGGGCIRYAIGDSDIENENAQNWVRRRGWMTKRWMGSSSKKADKENTQINWIAVTGWQILDLSHQRRFTDLRSADTDTPNSCHCTKACSKWLQFSVSKIGDGTKDTDIVCVYIG